ncbi:MAG TPA: glycosyltransferase family 39 protein [Solirubrobacteraceae bacterium]|nr:glycosyltransferase family 39 protein [Solirubrobacteraceae bacterium]
MSDATQTPAEPAGVPNCPAPAGQLPAPAEQPGAPAERDAAPAVPAHWSTRVSRWAAWAALAAITAGAAALRLAHLGQVPGDPFYDGAVRSMGLSWHNFYFGAVEPSGAVAIDKPPVDLWLQVASVKLLGFGSAALKTPEALAGTLAVVPLYIAIRPVFGVRAGLAAALALAVMPIEVITARSDTMDGVMMALTVLALVLLMRAARNGRTVWLLGAAAALGIAFDVKLLESVVALPALALIAWLGLPGSRRRRAAQLGLAGAMYVVVAMAWLTGTLLYPAHDRPWAYGSTNGSAWNSAFVFNGVDRLEGKALEGTQAVYRPGYRYPEATQAERDAIPILPPSPTRLLDRIGPLSGERLGLEALAGLLLGGAALAVLWDRRRRSRGGHPQADDDAGAHDPARALLDRRGPPEERLRLALLAGLMLWLLCGIALFSDMARLHPRYTEAFTPAVAGTLGIGVAWATERRCRARLAALSVTLVAVAVYAERLLFGATAVWWITALAGLGALALAFSGLPRRDTARAGLTALTCLCLLAIPLWASLRAVRENVSDTTPIGILHRGELAPLSAYLRAHQDGAYYEAAFDSGTKMGELVERDARPILVITTLDGHVFTTVAQLRAQVAAGRVRYAFIDEGCGPQSPPTDADCAPAARWAVAHGTDVSRQAGMPRPGMLWRLPVPATLKRDGGAHGKTQRSGSTGAAMGTLRR